MNYQYHHDGVNTRYTVNGVEYHRLEDVPEEHRAYFINLDKNKNGIPDSIEPLLSGINGGKTSFTKVIGALFKSVGDQMMSDDTAETPKLEEVTEQKRSTGRRDHYLRETESRFIPAVIKILVVVLIGLVVAWYFAG
jgi:hypothetical protein